MKRSILALCSTILFVISSARAQRDLVATPTPPMGWNSWDAYGLTITEQQFRDNVKVLHEKLQPFGYKYVVIDEGWFFFNPQDREKPDTLHYALDAHGRYVPVPERFPSAGIMPMVAKDISLPGSATPKFAADILATTFKPLADFVHAQGLLFGIHIVRGIPRASVERNLPIASPDEASHFTTTQAADTTDACPWDPTNWGVKDTPAGQAWYDSLISQYANWGVDLLKVDCISDHPYKSDEIRMIRRAIDKTGRPMVLSLSPGPTNPSHAQEVASLATQWRISDDVWDVWQGKPDKDGKPSTWPQSIKGQFDRAAQWAALDIPAGHYPDLDMLPFGELRPVPGWGQPRTSRLTLDEKRTQLTLWAMMRSPLILGANLTQLDDETLKLLTNKDLIALDQRPATDRVTFTTTQDLVTMETKLQRDGKSIDVRAYCNLNDAPRGAGRYTSDLSRELQTRKAVELWTGKTLGRGDSYDVQLAPHACTLVEIR